MLPATSTDINSYDGNLTYCKPIVNFFVLANERTYLFLAGNIGGSARTISRRKAVVKSELPWLT